MDDTELTKTQLLEKVEVLYRRVAELEASEATRQRIEEALRESEERYRHITTSITDYLYKVYVEDGQPSRTIHSAASEAVLGYTPKEFEQRPFLWLDVIHLDDRDRAIRFFDNALRRKQQGTLEHRIVHKNGDIRWVTNTIVFFKDLEGNIAEYDGIVRDITARKQAEEALLHYQEHLEELVEQRTRELQHEIAEHLRAEEALRKSEARFHTISDLVSDYAYELHVNPSGKLEREWVSGACPRITGYTQEEIDRLGGWMALVHPEDKMLVAHHRHVFLSGTKNIIEYRIMTKHHDVFWLREYSSPVKDEATGSVIRVFGAVQNVTVEKRMSEEIKATLREKESLLQEIHDRVKNNMQTLASMIRLQYGQIDNNKYVEILKAGEDRIQSIALIHELLYHTGAFSHINVHEYVHELAPRLVSSHTKSQNGIVLKLNVEPVRLDIETAIPCGLLINELVSNSLNHAFPDDGPGEMTISLRSTNANTFELVVSDTGVGLPKHIDPSRAETLGFTLIMGWVNQLQAAMTIERNGGTRIRIRFRELQYSR